MSTTSARSAMKPSLLVAVMLTLISACLPGCQSHHEQAEEDEHTIVVTNPKAMDVIITQQYVCQIHSQQHIQVRALNDGYLQKILVKEGQLVKKDQLMFKILPTIYEAEWKAELAEVRVAELDLQFTDMLAKKQGVSKNEVELYKAKLQRAQAKAKLAEAKWTFTDVKAPFDGIIDRLHEQRGSLIKERDILTSLSDNSVMWVYFNVPEARYYEYMRSTEQEKNEQRIELVLADGTKFKYPGNFRPFSKSDPAGAIESKFNNENGTVPFRADFQNPERLLRHGMTGTILIHRPLKNAVVIPQRATFEVLDKQYVYVVGSEDGKVHQHAIEVAHELEDIFVLKKGINVADKIVYEGVRQVHDGMELKEFEFRPPEQILAHQKYHAE
jgi:membrane fusion protein (multidrug efflux system)